MKRWQRLAGVVGACVGLLGVGCSPLGEAIDREVSSGYYEAARGDGVIFSAGGNWQMVGHHVVEGADREGFRPLAETIAVDRERVYYREHAQPAIDRESFEVEGKVWRDAAKVYFARAGETMLAQVEGADPASFRYLFEESVNPRMWARDAQRYYLEHVPIDVDAATFRFLNQGFVADREQVYRNQMHLTPVVDVSGPIEVINAFHLRMGTRVLSGGSWAHRVLEFEAIDALRSISDRVVVINDQVYEQGEQVVGWAGDSATLQAWPQNSTYARDAEHVYALVPTLRRIEGADRGSFEPMEGYGAYAQDAQQVYYRGQVLEGADRETFEIVAGEQGPYARDKHGAFVMGARR